MSFIEESLNKDLFHWCSGKETDHIGQQEASGSVSHDPASSDKWDSHWLRRITEENEDEEEILSRMQSFAAETFNSSKYDYI